MEVSMSSNQRWRIIVKNLETSILIGIYDHEKNTPQEILVNAIIESVYPLDPASVEECSNYELVYNLVTKEWPKRPHIDLLETCVTQLLQYIFENDPCAQYAKVCISKPERFPDAESVGIEAEMTREEFEKFVIPAKEGI
jgi:7,8-dihydroneopterin aldolase/epimerase/oxygenase